MSTTTPRTDAACGSNHTANYNNLVPAEFARQLETELIALQEENQRLKNDCIEYQHGHSEISKGVKEGLGLITWPKHDGRFRDYVCSEVAKVRKERDQLLATVEGLKKSLSKIRMATAAHKPSGDNPR